MDYYDCLEILISFEKGNDSDKVIDNVINKSFSLLSENDKELIEEKWNILQDGNNIRWKYIILIIFVIKAIQKENSTNKTETFTVKQMQTLKVAMEVITLLGIKPNCILYDKPSDPKQADILQRFERLIYTTNFFLSCFDDFLLTTNALLNLGTILTALIFIAHAVIVPPKVEANLSNNSDFNMSPELYAKMTTTQMEFKIKLVQLIEKCPVTMIMKELMVIHGTSKYPKFMRLPAKKYLIEQIMKPNGVISLISTMCNDDFTDLSSQWEKLETSAKLLSVSHGSNKDKYYDSICSQIIDLLKTTKITHSTSIAKCCIKALYEYDAEICNEKVFKIIAAPFLSLQNTVVSGNIFYSEQEVTESIKLLSACFISDESEFKQLPTEMLIPIIVPIFHLYVTSVNSISSFRQQIKQLTLKTFSLKNLREELFSIFLDYNTKFSHNYGKKLYFQLGNSGDFEVINNGEDIDHELFASALLELINKDKVLSFELFCFLLKSLSSFEKNSDNLLETNWDIMSRMTKQLSSINLLIQLANLSIVQKSNLEKPDTLLSFVKSLLNSKNISNKINTECDEDQMDVSYIGLMLVKVILSENKQCENLNPFKEFVSFLNQQNVSRGLSSNSKKLVEEITTLIKKKNNYQKKNYDDLSTSKSQSDFEKALEDLSDALLPVRAHGLISLTKLIENGDRETLKKKDILVCLLQENLNHDDSFIYLAAINGLCALTLRYPQNVIEILIQEFINMPQRTTQYNLSAENRAKLGEILVKATRNLGEMATVHKTPLINGFLCAVRDSDPLVRASSLSCLGELCKILGFRLGSILEEVIYCIGCIIKHDKEPECRRAAVLVITLLLRGLGKNILTSIAHHLLDVYKSLKYLRDNDRDDVIRLHAQLALEEIDDIVKNQLFVKPTIEKRISLLPS